MTQVGGREDGKGKEEFFIGKIGDSGCEFFQSFDPPVRIRPPSPSNPITSF